MNRPDSELDRGVRLSQALGWKARNDSTLTSTQIAFLSRQREGQVRTTRSRGPRSVTGQADPPATVVVAGAAVLLVGALVASTIAIRQTGNAKDNAAAAQPPTPPPRPGALAPRRWRRRY